MASRHCGYCRLAGHTLPSCPERLMERRQVVAHNVRERQHFAQMLMDRGMGNGAMMRVRWGYPRQETIGMMMEVEKLITQPQFVVFGKVKYSKRSLQEYRTCDPERSLEKKFIYTPFSKVNFEFFDCAATTMPNRWVQIGEVVNTFKSSEPMIEVLEPSREHGPIVWDKNIGCPSRLRNHDGEEYITVASTA